MRRNIKRKGGGFLAMSVGWLFADLLLALAMLFLIANTIAPARPVLIPTPTPTPRLTPTRAPTPTPTPNALLLDQDRVTLQIDNINPDGLSASPADAGSVSDLKQKIQAQVTAKGLQGRRAGIAIAYGGVGSNPSGPQIDQGTSVATEVYKVLDMLGLQKIVFCKTLHYDLLITFHQSNTTVVIDVYLFNKSVGGCDKVP